ncbi:hypothetical protein HRG_006878 [Hirsutella rhossiliensis]|uniref:Uncharacterized protein n=1 Tax=Hirsutella rhossiliensis TaxID=111463 RepID=A0A9P8MTD2_9HYPO|nr:uncharacterized protein HRG_06878 [Hirsutella rhossiliensis]KAH0961798.1 hypothetical protein HRG_06878 [Hirsutella rhossiliensis]
MLTSVALFCQYTLLADVAGVDGPDLLPGQVVTGAQLASFNDAHRYRNDSGGHCRLRIFMPADSPHINLCKTIMSAVAQGYPPPTLLNREGKYNRPEWHLAGSHTVKLESLLAVIEHLLQQTGDDGANEYNLAMRLDAYDIWFQLPPSVLIERHHRLNREADESVRKQWQAAQGFATGFPVTSPRESIVVTSVKDCHPNRDLGSDPHYAHWPRPSCRPTYTAQAPTRFCPGPRTQLVFCAPQDGHDSKSRRVQAFESSSADGSFVPIDWDGVSQKGSKPWHEELFGDGKGHWSCDVCLSFS